MYKQLCMVAQSAVAVALKLQWCLHVVGIGLLANELTTLAVQSHQEVECVVKTCDGKSWQTILHVGMVVPAELLLQALCR